MLSEVQIDIISELDRLVKREYELVALSGIITELQGLLSKSEKEGRVRLRKKVEFALEFLKTAQIKIFKEELLSSEPIDEYIIRVAKKKDFIVATNDQELRRKLREEHIAVVFVRQKSYLAVDGFIG